MKKLKMLLFVTVALLCSISVKAQGYENESNVPMPTVSREHHLKYKGVSLGETIGDFRRKLKGMGMTFISDNPNDAGFMSVENVGGALKNQDVSINYNSTQKSITSLSAYTFFRWWGDARPIFENILKEISQEYPDAIFDVWVFKNEYGSDIEKYCWKVLSDDKKYILGSVYVTIDKNEEDSHYSAEIKYCDYYNSMEADGIAFDDYDISSIMYPDYNYCSIYVDDDYLIFYPTKNNKTAMVVAGGDDRKNIIKILCSNLLKSEIRPYLAGYLNSLPIFNDEYVCYTSSCFNNKDVYWGIGDDIKRKNEQEEKEAMKRQYAEQAARQKSQAVQKSGAMSPAKQFMHGIYESILGKELVDFYKKNGTYDGMFNLFDKMVPAIGGDGTTSWDLLNDAQKAVIHEHDNGR